MLPADPTAAMLAEMGAVAHRLGMAFGREAERETDWARKRELFDLFDRCFFGVRVAISLRLRLVRTAGAAPGAQPSRDEAREAERERADPPETERPGRVRPDADREREGERASLPLLLKTLQGVAVDAAALPGPPPAALQSLTTLLARATGDPAIRPAPGALRTRFAGASALAMAIPPPRAAAHSFAAHGLRPRAATGPPR